MGFPSPDFRTTEVHDLGSALCEQLTLCGAYLKESGMCPVRTPEGTTPSPPHTPGGYIVFD